LSEVVGRFRDQELGAQDAIGNSGFEDVVERYYHPLYQFALSLTHTESDAADMTQQAFYLWATKGHQLRDDSKVKTWLFTTLHREFLRVCRQDRRFPHYELEDTCIELPSVEPLTAENLDVTRVLQALVQLPAVYQAPVRLFYLGEHSYKEIADILGVPVGTVQSRIARGKSRLQRMLATPTPPVAESDRRRR